LRLCDFAVITREKDVRLSILMISIAVMGCGGTVTTTEHGPAPHVEIPPVEVKLPQKEFTRPIAPKKTIPISLNKMRRSPELSLYEADKTENGHTWTWKNRNESVVIKADGEDEDHLFSCVVCVHQFDPHQPQADMTFAIEYLTTLFNHESGYGDPLHHHWVADRPLLPSVLRIGDTQIELKMVKGASMLVVTPCMD
jgi:hypothetical protein